MGGRRRGPVSTATRSRNRMLVDGEEIHYPCLQCPGCHILLSAEAAMAHVSGCAQCSGSNVTTKHDALVRRIYNLCMKAGIPCEREPRQFTSYKCTSCGASFDCGRICHLVLDFFFPTLIYPALIYPTLNLSYPNFS